MPKTLGEAVRLALQVRRGAPDECWPFVGRIGRNGYGHFNLKRDGKWSATSAHRVAYSLSVGTPVGQLSGVQVCHRCDNPPCCNPAHLFAGTRSDNMRDMLRKGRWNKPSRNGRTKCSDADVIEMRRLYGSGLSVAQLSERFGLSEGNTWAIVTRRRRSHLAEAEASAAATAQTSPPRKPR